MTKSELISKIIIWFPDTGKYNTTPPYEIYMQTKALADLPVDVLPIDGRFEDVKKVLDENHKETILFVVSTIIKYTSITIIKQVSNGQSMLEYIKENYNIPVALTGQAAGFLQHIKPETIKYDYIIKGISEEAVKTLSEKLIDDQALSKHDIQVETNDTSKNNKGYALYDFWIKYGNYEFSGINLEPYITNNSIDYIASSGCVNDCRFCTVPVNYHRHWYHNKVTNIIRHLQYLLKQHPQIKNIHFRDDNFFTNKTFVFNLINELQMKNITITWSAQTSVNILENYTTEELLELKKAGCDNISIGIESGDPEILKKYTKSKTDLSKNKKNIRRIINAEISASVTSIISFPDNNQKDFNKTIRHLMKLKLIHPKISMYCTIFQPIPGTKAFNDIYAGKVLSNKSSTFKFNTWTTTKEKDKLKKFERFYFVFDNSRFYKNLPTTISKKLKLFNLIFSPFIKLRFHLGYTNFLWEYTIASHKIKKIRKKHGIKEDTEFSKVGIRHLTSKLGYGYKSPEPNNL